MPTEISDTIYNAGENIPPSNGGLDLRLFPGTIQLPIVPYFERDGYRIIPMRSNEVDERLVRGIINSGFAPEMAVEQLFEDNVNALFLLEEQGRSVAVVNGRYLNVLATRKENWGNGAGKAVEGVYLELVEGRGGWRSRIDRLINTHYAKIPGVASARFRSQDGKDYNAYTVGISLPEKRAAHAFMYAKPSNFQ